MNDLWVKYIFLEKKTPVILMTITPDRHQNYFCYTESHDNVKLSAQWICAKRHGPDHQCFTAVCFSSFPWAGLSIHVANGNPNQDTDMVEQY